jgi:hypothetical protein
LPLWQIVAIFLAPAPEEMSLACRWRHGRFRSALALNGKAATDSFRKLETRQSQAAKSI